MKRCSVMFSARIAVLSIFIFLLCPLFVQAQNTKGDLIKSKMDSVITQTDRLAQNMDKLCPVGSNCASKQGSGQLLQDKIGKVKEAVRRVKNAKDRAKAEDFQEMLRKKGKGKSQGCVDEYQVCTGQGSTINAAQPSDDYDNDGGQDVADDLAEVDASLQTLNEVLESNAVEPDPTLPEAEFFFSPSARPSDTASFAAFLAELLAEKAAAIGTHFCDQTPVALGFGGNGAAVCAVTEGIAQAVGGVYDVMEYLDGSFQGAEITATYKRTKTLFDQGQTHEQ
jgi:hypothetical protein